MTDDERPGDDASTGESPTENDGTTGDEAESPASHSRLPRAGRVTARVAVALLSVLVLLGMGYGYTVFGNLSDSVHSTDAIGTLNKHSTPSTPPEQDGATDILLVGTDARTDMRGNPLPPAMLDKLRTERSGGLNTDTLILLRIPRDGGAPTAVSIPRDTWVRTPTGDMGKINSVYGLSKARTAKRLNAESDIDADQIARRSSKAGRQALISTLQRFTRVHIDHYAEVNLLGFYLLTKALGGVTVCLKAPTHDEDSGADFPAGVQELNAEEALSFVRQRKNLPSGLSRIRRQQAFLASALHKVLSADTLSDPDRLADLVDAAERSMVLDPELDLLEFVDQVRTLASDDVSFVTIPVTTITGTSPEGLSIVQADAAEVRDFLDGLVDDSTHSGAPSSGNPASSTPAPSSTTRSAPPSGGGSSPAGRSAHTEISADGIPCVY